MRQTLRSLNIVISVLVSGLLSGCMEEPELIKFKDDASSNQTINDGQLTHQFLDHQGSPFDLKRYLGQKHLVLVYVRGLPFPNGTFCPFCLAHTSSLLANYAEIQKRDAEVVIVFPGAAEKVPDFIQQSQLKARMEQWPFPLLLDKDCVSCDRLGIRGEQAKPSTFIIDKQGRVVFAYVGKTTSDRPSIKAILAQLDQLKGG